MSDSFSRDELLKDLSARMKDPKLRETLHTMSEAQLKVVAETLDDREKWKRERRTEPRKSQTRRVRVSPVEGEGFPAMEGLQDDVSSRGVGIFVNRPIQVGTRIKVHVNGQDCLGTVRRCQPDSHGWHIGVLYDPPADSGEPESG